MADEDFSKYKSEIIVLKMGFLGLAEEVTASYEVILGANPAVTAENSRRAMHAWQEAIIGFAPIFADYMSSKYTPEEQEEIFQEMEFDEETLREMLRQYGLDENGNPLE